MRHKFVEFIPPDIEGDVLYISIEYNVAKHKCACGCGANIVTTLSPARWQLTYDGETVSLNPSIGNWSHECKSHYLIKNDKVVWVGPITSYEMDEVIKNDKTALKDHINNEISGKSFIKYIKKLFRL